MSLIRRDSRVFYQKDINFDKTNRKDVKPSYSKVIDSIESHFSDLNK